MRSKQRINPKNPQAYHNRSQSYTKQKKLKLFRAKIELQRKQQQQIKERALLDHRLQFNLSKKIQATQYNFQNVFSSKIDSNNEIYQPQRRQSTIFKHYSQPNINPTRSQQFKKLSPIRRQSRVNNNSHNSSNILQNYAWISREELIQLIKLFLNRAPRQVTIVEQFGIVRMQKLLNYIQQTNVKIIDLPENYKKVLLEFINDNQALMKQIKCQKNANNIQQNNSHNRALSPITCNRSSSNISSEFSNQDDVDKLSDCILEQVQISGQRKTTQNSKLTVFDMELMRVQEEEDNDGDDNDDVEIFQ